MTRTFNWNYKADHAFGKSHVTDNREDQEAKLRDHAITERNYRVAAHRERQVARHERGSYLLDNIHA